MEFQFWLTSSVVRRATRSCSLRRWNLWILHCRSIRNWSDTGTVHILCCICCSSCICQPIISIVFCLNAVIIKCLQTDCRLRIAYCCGHGCRSLVRSRGLIRICGLSSSGSAHHWKFMRYAVYWWCAKLSILFNWHSSNLQCCNILLYNNIQINHSFLDDS